MLSFVTPNAHGGPGHALPTDGMDADGRRQVQLEVLVAGCGMTRIGCDRILVPNQQFAEVRQLSISLAKPYTLAENANRVRQCNVFCWARGLFLRDSIRRLY